MMKRAVYDAIGGLGLNWLWRVICSCTILEAGRLWGTGSMPNTCSIRMRRSLQRNGGTLFRRDGRWRCGLGRMGRGLGLVRLVLGYPRSTLAVCVGLQAQYGQREADTQGSDVRLKPNLLQPRVSLTMIVRDEENNIGRGLESVRGVFDEIVVVDTGSNDRTVEIARSFGAHVFDFVWVDDFGAARNAALARAKGDYAFWLDADDLIEPTERAKLEGLFGRLRSGGTMPAFVVRSS